MKKALTNKTAEKSLKVAIFKLLVLSYMHTILLYFFLLFEQYYKVLCRVKIQEKSLNQHIWFLHISKY